MRRVVVLFLVGLIFFLLSFFLVRNFFSLPQVTIPLELVGLSRCSG